MRFTYFLFIFASCIGFQSFGIDLQDEALGANFDLQETLHQIDLHTPSAIDGDAESQFKLGLLYDDLYIYYLLKEKTRENIIKSIDSKQKAFCYMLSAADLDLAEAKEKLASWGEGISKDNRMFAIHAECAARLPDTPCHLCVNAAEQFVRSDIDHEEL